MARDLLRKTESGDVVWLRGELGAGKTTFCRAVVDAAGGRAATSPTFALLHVYDSEVGSIAHADCYRLKDPEEAFDLDLHRLASQCRLTLIEWPERAGDHAPAPSVQVEFHHRDRDTREIRFDWIR